LIRNILWGYENLWNYVGELGVQLVLVSDMVGWLVN
jgi:hypothetical protein